LKPIQSKLAMANPSSIAEFSDIFPSKSRDSHHHRLSWSPHPLRRHQRSRRPRRWRRGAAGAAWRRRAHGGVRRQRRLTQAMATTIM
jgi:hypothetical protein